MNFCRLKFIFLLMMIYVDGAPTGRLWADLAEEESNGKYTNDNLNEEIEIPEGEPIIDTPIYKIIDEAVKKALNQRFDKRNTADEVNKDERSSMDQSNTFKAIDDAVIVALNKRLSESELSSNFNFMSNLSFLEYIDEAVKQALSQRLLKSKRAALVSHHQARSDEITGTTLNEDMNEAINQAVKDALSLRLSKSKCVISFTQARGGQITSKISSEDEDIFKDIYQAVNDALTQRLSKSKRAISVAAAHSDEITSTVNQAVKDALSQSFPKSENISVSRSETRELPDITQEAMVSNKTNQDMKEINTQSHSKLKTDGTKLATPSSSMEYSLKAKDGESSRTNITDSKEILEDLDKNLLLKINKHVERTLIGRLSEIGLLPQGYFLRAVDRHVKRVLNRKFLEAGLITEKKLGMQTSNVQISERSNQQKHSSGDFSSRLASPSKPYSEALIGKREGSSAKFLSQRVLPSKLYSEALTGSSRKERVDEFTKLEQVIVVPIEVQDVHIEEKENLSEKTEERTSISSTEIENAPIDEIKKLNEKKGEKIEDSSAEEENNLSHEAEKKTNAGTTEIEFVPTEEMKKVNEEKEGETDDISAEEINNASFMEIESVPTEEMEEVAEEREERTGDISAKEINNLIQETKDRTNDSIIEIESIPTEEMEAVAEEKEEETENVSAEEKNKVIQEKNENRTNASFTKLENVPIKETEEINDKSESSSIGSLKGKEKYVNKSEEEYKLYSETPEVKRTAEEENNINQKQENIDSLDKRKTASEKQKQKVNETKQERYGIASQVDLNKHESVNKKDRRKKEEDSSTGSENTNIEEVVQSREPSIENPTGRKVTYYENVAVGQTSSMRTNTKQEEPSIIYKTKVLVRPKLPGTGTDMFKEICALTDDPAHYNIFTKDTVSFPSEAVLVTFRTKQGYDSFRRAVETSDKIVVKTDEGFPHLVWILNLSIDVKKEHIDATIYLTFHERPLEVEFTETKFRHVQKVAHIEVSESLFNHIKCHPFVRIIYNDYYIYTSIEARRCTLCWFLGHTNRYCPYTPTSFPVDKDNRCIDCIKINSFCQQKKQQLRYDSLGDVDHKTNSDVCPTKSKLKSLSNLYKMRVLHYRLLKQESKLDESTSTNEGSMEESLEDIAESFSEHTSHSHTAEFTFNSDSVTRATDFQISQNTPTIIEEKQTEEIK